MPELPEVEIVKQSLKRAINHKKIRKVIVKNRNLRFKLPINFEKTLQDKVVSNISRLSKYIIIEFKSGLFCIFHLGMSGTVHIIRKKIDKITNLSFYQYKQLPAKHNHIKFIFSNFKIIYNDPRRFGFFEIINNSELLKKRFVHLGPEPFEKKFNSDYVFSFFKGKKKNIKNFLLDQNFVSGIGNIYASEILYLSKIKPDKKGRLLKIEECEKLEINSKIILLNAIKRGGSSIRNFKSIIGKEGNFQKNFKVYQREGLKCKRVKCNGIITKKNISNRSSFFCNSCQK